jgi:hypothetical protein
MRAQDIDQWDDTYPNIQIVEDDARAESLFVMRQDTVCVASVCLNDVQPAEHPLLRWRCEGALVLVVHQLCMHPE